MGSPGFLYRSDASAPPCSATTRPGKGRENRVFIRRAGFGRPPSPTSTVWRIQSYVARNFALPPIAIGEQLVLVIVQFFAGLGRELKVRTFNDRVDRASFLAEAAIDALHHVDVVAHRATGSVIAARTSFDGDRL